MSGLINYLTASKGSLMCNNNQYIINRCLYEKTYYRCCIHKQFKCPATLTISDDKIEYVSENHNHDQYLPVNAEYIIMLSNLKMITETKIIHCFVKPQEGIVDCGLFALAYCLAICHNLDPAQMNFDQSAMREHYNNLYFNNMNNFPYILQAPLGSNIHTLTLD
jgi:hypothetical protein